MREAYIDYTRNVSSPIYAISMELSKWLLSYLKEHKPERILDLGSGWSSYVLRLTGADVWSVDTSQDWLEKTQRFLEKYGLLNGHFALIEDFEWEDLYDLILVDTSPIDERGFLFAEYVEHCRGIIVLDDTNRAWYQMQILACFEEERLTSLKEETVDRWGRYAWVYDVRIPLTNHGPRKDGVAGHTRHG